MKLDFITPKVSVTSFERTSTSSTFATLKTTLSEKSILMTKKFSLSSGQVKKAKTEKEISIQKFKSYLPHGML